MTTEEAWEARIAEEQRISNLQTRRFGPVSKEVHTFEQFKGVHALIAEKKRERDFAAFNSSMLLQGCALDLERQLQVTEQRIASMLAASEQRIIGEVVKIIADEFEDDSSTN